MPRCHTCPAETVPAKTRCAACLERVRLYVANRRAAGLCTCGKQAAPEHSACRECLDRTAAKKRADYAIRRAEGRCGHKGCASRAQKGYVYCGVHRLLIRIASRTSRWKQRRRLAQPQSAIA